MPPLANGEQEEEEEKQDMVALRRSSSQSRELTNGEVAAILKAVPEYRHIFTNAEEYNLLQSSRKELELNPPRPLLTAATSQSTTTNSNNNSDEEDEDALCDLLERDCEIVKLIREIQ